MRVPELPPVLADVVSEAAGQTSRPDPVVAGSGGPAGNARLTAWTGLVLLALSLAELVTLLDVRGLITWHVVIGAILIPPALLKTASTGWRIVRYYRGSASYTTAGPPPMILRLLGPLVVVSTLGLLASGVVLVLLGPDGSRASLVELPGFRVDWITVHQGAFLVWAAATGLHVLGRFVPALNLTLAAPPRDAVPGVRGRGLALLLTGIAAVAAGAVALALAGSWHGDQGGDSEGARPPAAVTAAAAVR